MQAIILAGGKGTRLKPYTTVLPKPLMPVGDRPILEIVLRQLKENGFRDIVISTGHLAGLIRAYFSDGKKFGLKINYLYETTPLNTAGAIKLLKSPEENFLVMNGDILCDVNYRKLFKEHLAKKSLVTICVKKRTVKIDYGVIEIDMGSDASLAGYIEKPQYDMYVSTGIYVMNKKVLSYIKKGEAISMPDLMKRLLANGKKIHCKIHDGFWLDIGRQEDYQKANDIFALKNGSKIRRSLCAQK